MIAGETKRRKVQDSNKMTRIKLEEFKRFSQSIMWRLMMDFYSSSGKDAWSKEIVPSFITSNCHIAKSYARLLAGYIHDLVQLGNIDSKHKLYIVELGGGSGRLAFLILKELEKIKDRIDFPFHQIVYILTDFAEANIQFWEQHQGLSQFVKDGRLDFAKYEAVNDNSLKLRVAGTILRKNQVKNPICIVANYLIDTLCHDVFQVRDGVLMEGLVSVGYNRENDSENETQMNALPMQDGISKLSSQTSTMEIIENLDNEYKYQPIDVNYYGSENEYVDTDAMTSILTWYRQYFQVVDEETRQKLDASFLIPIGFLKALQNLTALSAGEAFVLTGDKGIIHPDRFQGLQEPHLAKHGSFSVMVNFHAIVLYCIHKGGCAFLNAQEDASIHVNGFVFTNRTIDPSFKGVNYETLNRHRQHRFTNLDRAFHDFINAFSPNDFYMLQKSLKNESNPSLPSILSLIKLSNYEPLVFYKFRDIILSEAPGTLPMLRLDVLNCVKLLWDNYYHLDSSGGADVAFELGRLCFGLQVYQEAIKYYSLSLTLFEKHHITYYNIGLCHVEIRDYDLAISFFKTCLDMNPEYVKAQQWINRVTQRAVK